MKKFKSIVLLSVFCAVMMLFGLIGFSSANSVKADEGVTPFDETVAKFNNLPFKMNGARIRKNTYPGISFEVCIDNAQYDLLSGGQKETLAEEGDYNIDETGILFIPAAYVSGGENLTAETSGVAVLPRPVESKDGGYILKGGISPIDSSLYDVSWTARGYIKYKVINDKQKTVTCYRYAETQTEKGDMATRSLKQITDLALNDENNGFTQIETEFVSLLKDKTPITPDKTLYNLNETIDLKAGFGNKTDLQYCVSVNYGQFTDITDNIEAYELTQDGIYNFKSLDQKGASDSFVIDVVSDETRFDVIDVESMFACGYYNWDSGKYNRATEVVTEERGGKNGKFAKYANQGEGTVILGIPKHSKAYYQSLLNEYSGSGMSLNVELSYYIDIDTPANLSEFNTAFASQVHPLSPEKTPELCNQWVTQTVSLSDFIDNHYDNLHKGYIWERNQYCRGVEHKKGNNDYILWFYNVSSVSAFRGLYIDDIKIVPAGNQNLGVKLIDRKDLTVCDLTAEIDNFSDAVNIHHADNVTLTSRYGEKNIPLNDYKFDINDEIEDGIYYLLGKQGDNECFNATLDIYDSRKPVEVESFGHSDSKYAVKVYYAKYDTAANGVMDLIGALPDKITEDNYRLLSFDDANPVISFKKMTLTPSGNFVPDQIYGAENLTDVPYLAIDESKLTADSPLTTDNGAKTHLYFYVMPRHTKEYYTHFKDGCDKYGFAYAGGLEDGSQRFQYIDSTYDDHIGYLNDNGTWAADPKTYMAVNGRDTNGPTKFTIDNFIEHYDDFTDCKIWSFVLDAPGATKTTLEAKMFSVVFISKPAAA